MIPAAQITVADFKAFFIRDFRYASDYPGITVEGYVTDADINKAFTEALANWNDSLFPDDTTRQVAFLQLSAHFLATDLQAASQGAGSTTLFPVVSRTAGPVSETYNAPLWLQHDPVMSSYATTRYGMTYIALVKPLLIGGMMVICGDTTPA